MCNYRRFTWAKAQSTSGRIIGTVRDQQEAIVAGAKVTVTDTLRNIAHAAVTDENGEYLVGDLQPSLYKVNIEQRGFNGFQRPRASCWKWARMSAWIVC